MQKINNNERPKKAIKNLKKRNMKRCYRKIKMSLLYGRVIKKLEQSVEQNAA